MFIVPFKGAITKMTSFAATSAEVQKEIMSWLRNASDRNGGRKQRQQAKQQEAGGGRPADTY